MTFTRALKLGFTQAMSLPGATLGMAAARMVDALATVTLSAALIAGVMNGDAGAKALIGMALVASAAAVFLRALLLGGGLTQGHARVRELPKPALMIAAADASRRSFVYAVLAALLDFVARSWVWLALGSSGWLFVRALLHREGGAFSAAALAFTLTVALPLLLAVALLTETAFARAIARGEPYAVAVYETVGSLWARPWPALSLFLICGVIAGLLQFPVSAMVSALTSSTDPFAPTDWSLVFAGQFVVAILGSIVGALTDHARAQSLLALEADGHQPLPPAPIPVAPVIIPVAAVIPVAPVLPPEGGSA